MNLLPRSRQDFSSKSYWEGFFQKRKDTFEWYGEYTDLCGILHKYCKVGERIMMAGCGNSKLSEDLYDVGYNNIVNIDISELVIKQMTRKNEKKRPKMTFHKMDVKNVSSLYVTFSRKKELHKTLTSRIRKKGTSQDVDVKNQTTFTDEEFNVVIDKGTLDALFTDNNNENVFEIRNMFTEFHRILKSGGRYICITLAQSHILEELFNYFPSSWFVRVHRIDIVSGQDDADTGVGSKLPVFAFVFTKMKMKLVKPVLELIDSEDSKIEKFSNAEELKAQIRDRQGYAIIQNKLGHSSLEDDLVTLDLWSSAVDCKEPRYTLKVIDTDASKLSSYNGAFAIFIVPQGREIEGMFAAETGLRNLAEMAGFTRLVVATLHRGHIYKDIEEIKSDLSQKVMELAPKDTKPKAQVPFLTAASDIGVREIMEECKTSIDQVDYVVEDVKSPEDYYCRQLVFLNEPNTAQAQVRLTIDKSTKKKARLKKRIPDHRYLLKSHHKALLAGLSLLHTDVKEDWNLLMLGSKNSCFISFLLNLFDKISCTCIDSDDKMVESAVKWFGFPSENDRLKVISDPQVALNLEPDTYDMLVKFDEISLENRKAELTSIKRSIKPGGVFAMHRYEDGSEEFINELNEYFPLIFTSTVEDGTLILYCYNTTQEEGEEENENGDLVYDRCGKNAAKLKDFIYSKRPGFYEKTLWNILVDYADDLFEVSS